MVKTIHPQRPLDRRVPPKVSVSPLESTVREVLLAVRSFAPGSSGGVDGLRPQHLLDMLQGVDPGQLGEAISSLITLVLAGGVPDLVRPVFFGGRLFALSKPGGGIRPIAVGMTLRRLAAKIAHRAAIAKCATVLAPHQLGVGVKGGCEAAVHAARCFLSTCPADSALLKIDFKNAFNTIRRDCVLEAVASHIPELLPFLLTAYSEASVLQFGDFEISSEEGVQQGDPLGPLLFSITVAEMLNNCRCDFVVGYLDDFTLGGTIDSLVKQVHAIEEGAGLLGLCLNYSKCEVIGLSPQNRSFWQTSFPSIAEVALPDASLLGTPLLSEGVEQILGKRLSDLKVFTKRLKFLSSHEGLFLLNNALAKPKLMYILRTSPCFGSCGAISFDETLRSTLASVTNCFIRDEAWLQAALPKRWGGLGIRSVSSLASSAFLASASSAHELVTSLLPPGRASVLADHMSLAEADWRKEGGAAELIPSQSTSQKAWDDVICSAQFEVLMASGSVVDKARLLACRADTSGSWLSALPSANIGLRLGDSETRISVGLRLGVEIVAGHNCVCGARVSPDGLHGLSCRRSAGRHSRHSSINNIIALALKSADIPAHLEPNGLLRNDGKRPDGATLVPWARGRCLLWDFTCPDTLAPSHLYKSSIATGSAASEAEIRKSAKYSELSVSNTFIPVAVETFGAWGPEAISFIAELGRRIAATTGEPRSTVFLRQRIDIALQRGNAASVLGTLHDPPPEGN